MTGVKFCEPNVVWDLECAHPDLFNFLKEQNGWPTEDYYNLKKKVPTAETFAVFDSEHYFRPAQHFRAFYKKGLKGDVIAFKGSEVVIDDLADFLFGLSQQKLDGKGCLVGVYSYSYLEHFPLIEQKIPGALLLKEALQEAQAAADFQLAYLRRYKELAEVPMPLFVHQWPQETVDHFLAILKPMLSSRAYGIVQQLAAEGLGYYVYYFHSSPQRVRHLTIQSDPFDFIKGYPYWMSKLEKQINPEIVINGWIQLIARMLLLGYLPYTVSHRYIGQCIEEQNTVVSGGFVDMDSIRPIHQITDEREFYESFFNTVITFSNTLKKFLLGELAQNEGDYCSKMSSLSITSCLWDELKHAIKVEEKEGHFVDQRIHQLMFGASFCQKVSPALSGLYPELKSSQQVLQKFFSHHQ
jgi:hypothetical protein